MRVKHILNQIVCADIMAADCTSLGFLADIQRVLSSQTRCGQKRRQETTCVHLECSSYNFHSCLWYFTGRIP